MQWFLVCSFLKSVTGDSPSKINYYFAHVKYNFCPVAVFVEQPSSVNTSINSTVWFDCVCSNCIAQHWEINDVPAYYSVITKKGIESFGPDMLSSGDKHYSLLVPGLEEFNNTEIVSIISSSTLESISSNRVYLIIQGNW